jgi:hypothetical protein
MEESQNQVSVNDSLPSYWESIGIAALIFGIIYFAITLIGGYATINSEPSGSMFGSIGQIVSGSLACIVAGFGGMLAIWHYVNSYEELTLKLGKGALIGLYTAIAIAIIGTVLSQVWNLIDPSFTDKLMDSMIANYEQMEGVSDAQKQQIIDGIASEFKNSQTFWGILKGMLFAAIPLSIINVATGMIGAKIFAEQEN